MVAWLVLRFFYTTAQRHLNISEGKNNRENLNIPTMSYTHTHKKSQTFQGILMRVKGHC